MKFNIAPLSSGKTNITVSGFIATCILIMTPVSASYGDRSSFLTLHAGQERRENLEWRGLTYGVYIDSYSSNPVGQGGFVSNLVNAEDIAASVEFSLNQIDKSFFRETRYDVSIIPKFRYFFNNSFYTSAGLGVGYNEVEEEDRRKIGLALGGKWFFAPEANLGYEFNVGSKRGYIELIYTHRSNAGISEHNQSLNFFLIAAGLHL